MPATTPTPRQCCRRSACARCACSPTTHERWTACGDRASTSSPSSRSPPLRTAATWTTSGRRNAASGTCGPPGHLGPPGETVGDEPLDVAPAVDISDLIGPVAAPRDRPFVVLKFAQTLDGRIATATGDARWISGEPERRASHALRAACDAVLVGVGTVLQDDPQLTVRMVPGASPMRVVLDSTLRVPDGAKILGTDAATMILTTERSDPARRGSLATRRIGVNVLPAGAYGVDIGPALGALRRAGVETLLVEGGARVITSLLSAGVVARLIGAV